MSVDASIAQARWPSNTSQSQARGDMDSDRGERDTMLAASLHALLAHVRELSGTPEDDADPYASKYAARRILVDFLASSLPSDADSAEAPVSTTFRAVTNVCKATLGILCVQTEEFGTGERLLALAVEQLLLLESSRPYPDDATLRALVAATLLEGCNLLAVVYSGWDDAAGALCCLRNAARVYARYHTVAAPAQNDPPASLLQLASRIEEAHTSTAFYLAQVYASLGEPAIAAHYCAQTLVRQLPGLSSLLCGSPHSARDVGTPAELTTTATATLATDPIEFSRNALRLSVYYARRATTLRWAVGCLTCADIVLCRIGLAEEEEAHMRNAGSPSSFSAEVEPPSSAAPTSDHHSDALQRLMAESATHWANLYASCLATARNRELGREMGVALDNDDEKGVEGGPRVPTPRMLPLQPRTVAAAAAASSSLDPQSLVGTPLYWSDAVDGFPPTSSSPLSDPLLWIDIHGDDGVDDGGLPSADALLNFAAAAAGAVPPACQFYGPAVLPSVATTAAAAVSLVSLSSAPASTHPEVLSPAGSSPRCPGRSVSGLSSLLSATHISKFEDARRVFKASTAACDRALRYFRVDGFVSEHAGIQLTVARLYKHVSEGGGLDCASYLRRWA